MPTTRASDAEREQHVDLLREHAAHGRLTVDELSDRLDRAYAARTRDELAALLRDLPGRVRPVSGPPGRLGSFALISLMLIAIWAATGADYFWPMWPILGIGISLVSKRMTCARVTPG